MSNEMTDELRALDLIYHEVGDTKEARDAYEFLSARLRGESEQPAAVAGDAVLSSRLRAGVECAPWVIDEVRKMEAALSAAPAAPAPVAGDAVAALPAAWRERANWTNRYGMAASELEVALAQDRAAQAEGFVMVRKSDLTEVHDTLEYWINRQDRRGMSEAEFRSWHTLGHGSKAMTALRSMLAAAPVAPERS